MQRERVCNLKLCKENMNQLNIREFDREPRVASKLQTTIANITHDDDDGVCSTF